MSDWEKNEEVLKKNGFLVSTIVGVSMFPMLRNRKDTIVVKPISGKLKKYDVPLYKSGTRYVLHRIVEVRPHDYVIIGDNCVQKEYVKDEQIIGVLTEFYRGEKRVDMDGWQYRAYVRGWCALYPFRCLYKKGRSFLVRVKRKVLQCIG